MFSHFNPTDYFFIIYFRNILKNHYMIDLNVDNCSTKGQQMGSINITEIQEKVKDLQNSLKYLESVNTQVYYNNKFISLESSLKNFKF